MPEYPAAKAESGTATNAAPGAARNLVVQPKGDDAALAVPRAVLQVPNAFFEMVFVPLRALAVLDDQFKLHEHAIDLLYNDARTAAFYPIIVEEPEYPISFGIGAFHKDLFGHKEEVQARATIASDDEFSFDLSFRALQLAGKPVWFEAAVRGDYGASLMFAGIGHSPERSDLPRLRPLGPREYAVETWLRENRLQAMVRGGMSFGEGGELARLGLTGIYNLRQFAPNHDNDEPSVEEVYDTSQIPGYDETQQIVELDANLVVDTRDRAGFTRNGVRMESYVGAVPPRGERSGWARYGLDLGGWLDLYLERVLSIRGAIDVVAGPAEDINFAELPRLGGGSRLRGYPTGRFRDLAAALVTVQYEYPIHSYVSGELFVDVGKVGPGLGELFGTDPEGLRPGVGGGLLFHDRKDLGVRMDIAWGLDQGVGFYLSLGALADIDERLVRP